MVIDTNQSQVRMLEQVRQREPGTQALRFKAAQDDVERYAWIEAALSSLQMPRLSTAQARRSRSGAGLRAAVERVQPRPGDAAGLALYGRLGVGQELPRSEAGATLPPSDSHSLSASLGFDLSLEVIPRLTACKAKAVEITATSSEKMFLAMMKFPYGR